MLSLHLKKKLGVGPEHLGTDTCMSSAVSSRLLATDITKTIMFSKEISKIIYEMGDTISWPDRFKPVYTLLRYCCTCAKPTPDTVQKKSSGFESLSGQRTSVP